MVISMPHAPMLKYMAQSAWHHGDVFCWTWAVLARAIFGSESSLFAPMVALSSQGNVVVVAIFMSALGLDCKGCCMHQLHSCGFVIELKLLSLCETDPWSFLISYALFLNPTSFLQASVKPSCLIAVIACWTCTLNCSGVPRDCADTLYSTLPSRVSFAAFCRSVHCHYEFLLVRDWWTIASASHLALLGLYSVRDCLDPHHFLGLLWVRVPMKKRPEETTWSVLCERHNPCWSHALGVGINCPTRHWLEEVNSMILVGLDHLGLGSRCPTRWLLAEMNSLILVGFDVLGIGSHCLGEESKLAWYQLEITVAVAWTGTRWLGLLGNLAIDAGRSHVHGYQLIVNEADSW